MLLSRKVIALVIGICSIAAVQGQTVKVIKETSRIKNESTEGYAVSLDGTADEVNTALLRFFKSIGKVKQSDGVLLLTESSLNGSSPKVPVYGLAKSNGASATAWIGLRADEWPDGQADKMSSELEKTMYEFGVKFYKDRIQVQVDESVQALQAVEKQQQRLTFENKSLNQKLEYNQKEKARLEKALENNKLEYEELLKRLEKNKHDQDSVGVAGAQIGKVVEMHKERQGKVK